MVANRGCYGILFATIAVCSCGALFASKPSADTKRVVPIEAPPVNDADAVYAPYFPGATLVPLVRGGSNWRPPAFDGQAQASGTELLQYEPDPFPRWLRLALEENLSRTPGFWLAGEVSGLAGMPGAGRRPFFPNAKAERLDMRNVVRDAPLFPTRKPKAEHGVTLRPGEAANEILQIRKSLGGGALLQGTIFQQPEYQSPSEDERIFIDAIRRSEREAQREDQQRRTEAAPAAARYEGPTSPRADSRGIDSRGVDSRGVEVLRDVSATR